MITRIIQHHNFNKQGFEDCIIRFDKQNVTIVRGDKTFGGPISELHAELVAVYNESDIFLMEELAVNYDDRFVKQISSLFNYYANPHLGMIYFDLIGNENTPSIYYQRYTPEFVLGNKPKVSALNKLLCPGLPMMLDLPLLEEIAQKAPILYIPGDLVTLA